MSKKKIMVIAGGAWQKPIIEKIKTMGHEVLCTNLYDDTVGIMAADKKVIADVLDKEKNLEIAKEYKPDLVITDQSDIAVETCAYVSEQLGLPGIGIDKAELFTNKLKIREFETNHGLVGPAYKGCNDYQDAVEFLEKHPVSIIKPLNSQSSRGVYIVKKDEDFRVKFNDSKKYTHGSSMVLIEEYIDGTEFTVDGIKIGENYQVLAISEKKHYKHNPNIASELFFSKTNNRYDYEILKKKNIDLVQAMGLPFGLTHAEYKYKDGEFYLIEIAARGGGTLISSHIAPIMSGVDSYKVLLDYVLEGRYENFDVSKEADTCAVLKFIEVPTGKVKSISGVDIINGNTNIVAFKLDFKVGDIIELPDNDRSRKGFFIAYEKDTDALDNLCKWIEKTLVVELETL